MTVGSYPEHEEEFDKDKGKDDDRDEEDDESDESDDSDPDDDDSQVFIISFSINNLFYESFL